MSKSKCLYGLADSDKKYKMRVYHILCDRIFVWTSLRNVVLIIKRLFQHTKACPYKGSFMTHFQLFLVGARGESIVCFDEIHYIAGGEYAFAVVDKVAVFILRA